MDFVYFILLLFIGFIGLIASMWLVSLILGHFGLLAYIKNIGVSYLVILLGTISNWFLYILVSTYFYLIYEKYATVFSLDWIIYSICLIWSFMITASIQMKGRAAAFEELLTKSSDPWKSFRTGEMSIIDYKKYYLFKVHISSWIIPIFFICHSIWEISLFKETLLQFIFF